MKHLLFSEKQKLADLIHINFKLLLVLPRFDIKLGFGDKNVAEVCEQYGASTELFLLVCNIYTFDEYFPDKRELSQIHIDDLTCYLQKSHDYYIKDQIPAIQTQLANLVRCYDQKQGALLTRFFEDYRAEVANHLSYEENTVFPYILDLLKGKSSGNYSIEQFEANHSNIEDKLNDLKNIIIKYLPDNCQSDLRNKILFNLFLLEEDLNKHSLFEDKILVPFVQRLENHNDEQEKI